MRFEWDDAKAAANLRKRGVGFEEAAEVFQDPDAFDDYDREHSDEEARFFIVSPSGRRLLYVIYAERAGDVPPGMKAESMSEKETARPFVFSVVDDDGEDLTIEVSEEDYRRDVEAGAAEEETVKPGRYKLKRGGFLKRHPKLKDKMMKRA